MMPTTTTLKETRDLRAPDTSPGDSARDCGKVVGACRKWSVKLTFVSARERTATSEAESSRLKRAPPLEIEPEHRTHLVPSWVSCECGHQADAQHLVVSRLIALLLSTGRPHRVWLRIILKDRLGSFALPESIENSAEWADEEMERRRVSSWRPFGAGVRPAHGTGPFTMLCAARSCLAPATSAQRAPLLRLVGRLTCDGERTTANSIDGSVLSCREFHCTRMSSS